MYLTHLGLSQLPYTLTPNTQFYCELPPHQEALQVLHAALAAGEGFIQVTGEVGTGKTMICRKLINELADDYQFAWLPNPYLSGDELRRALATELGLPAEHDALQLTQQISDELMRCALAKKPVVVVVDEAQALPDDSLEALRLFTNLETESFKLLQVVLLGQPELDQRLAEPQLRQLRQRITFSYRLRGLSLAECQDYLEYRLHVAGFDGVPMFAGLPSKLIWQASGGIPWLVNVLAHKCLILAYGANTQRVTAEMVSRAIADTDATASLPRFYGWRLRWQARLAGKGGYFLWIGFGLLWLLGWWLRVNLEITP